MDDTEAKSPANDEAATSTVLQHDDLTGTGANKETTDDSRPTKQRVTVLQMVCAGFWTMGINYAFNAGMYLASHHSKHIVHSQVFLVLLGRVCFGNSIVFLVRVRQARTIVLPI